MTEKAAVSLASEADLQKKNYEEAILKYMAQAAIRISTNIPKLEFLTEIEKSLSPQPFGVVKIKNTKNHYRLHFRPSSIPLVQNLKQTMAFLKVGPYELKNLDYCPKVDGQEWSERRAYDYIIFVDPYYTLDMIRTKLQEKGVEVLLINHDIYSGFRTGWTKVKATSIHKDSEVTINIANNTYSLILLATKIRKAKLAKEKKAKQAAASLKEKEKQEKSKANPLLDEWLVQGRKSKQLKKKNTNQTQTPIPTHPKPPTTPAAVKPSVSSLNPLPPPNDELFPPVSTVNVSPHPGTTETPPLSSKKLKKLANKSKKK